MFEIVILLIFGSLGIMYFVYQNPFLYSILKKEKKKKEDRQEEKKKQERKEENIERNLLAKTDGAIDFLKLWRGPSLLNVKNLDKKYLVLDLDETLIHSSFVKKKYGERVYPMEIYIDKRLRKFYVSERPDLSLFLETLSKWFHICVFTASISKYADSVLSHMGHNSIRIRYYRENCHKTRLGYVKKLRTICPEHMSLKEWERKVILLDNNPASFCPKEHNGILCTSWTGDKVNDRELRNLIPVLELLRHVDDVRHVIGRKNWMRGKMRRNSVQKPQEEFLSGGSHLLD